MPRIFSLSSLPAILFFTIIALLLVVVISFYVDSAKKRMGPNMLYLIVGGIFIGIVGIRATALDNVFYMYMVILCWNLIAGTIHVFLSRQLLIWPKNEPYGWKLLYGFAIVLIGFSALLTFMKMFGYDILLWYNISAMLTFFIPLTIQFSYESYLAIPAKIFLPQKAWMYNRNTELKFRADDISHFFIIRYRLTTQSGGQWIDSLPMRAPGQIKLGDYFNSTLECYKVTQGRYSIEVRDQSNNYVGWYLFLSEGSGKLLDPNKTLLECGLSNPVYFGNSTPEEIDLITNQADREGKTYVITCLRAPEYTSQLLQS